MTPILVRSGANEYNALVGSNLLDQAGTTIAQALATAKLDGLKPSSLPNDVQLFRMQMFVRFLAIALKRALQMRDFSRF